MAVSIPELDMQGAVPEHSPFDSDPTTLIGHYRTI